MHHFYLQLKKSGTNLSYHVSLQEWRRIFDISSILCEGGWLFIFKEGSSQEVVTKEVRKYSLSYKLCSSICSLMDEWSSPWMLAMCFKNTTVKFCKQGMYFKVIIYLFDKEHYTFTTVREVRDSFPIFCFIS